MRITIHTSHATYGDVGFIIDEAGNVLETCVDASFGLKPVKFDVAEYVAFWGKLDDSIDVLDIGYTLENGEVVEAVADFREEAILCGAVRV